MIIHSAELAAAINNPSTRRDNVRIKVLDQFGQLQRTLIVIGGAIPADDKATVMRSFEVQVFDPTGQLVPRTLRDILAPGWRIQVERATKIILVLVHEQLCDSVESWSDGDLYSVVVEADGLTLGD